MEVLADHLKQIPVLMSVRLTELRRTDKQSRNLITEITAQENALIEELQAYKNISPAEEAVFTERSAALLKRRHDVLTKLDNQMKIVQNAYDQIDTKISYLDACTKNILYLFPQTDEAGGDGRKKKKRKANVDADEGFNEAGVFVDPNEPVYCTCRQVSYGQMIACENPDCETEWFHFACVGLTTEPKDPWYCSVCRGDGGDADGKVEEAPDEAAEDAVPTEDQ